MNSSLSNKVVNFIGGPTNGFNPPAFGPFQTPQFIALEPPSAAHFKNHLQDATSLRLADAITTSWLTQARSSPSSHGAFKFVNNRSGGLSPSAFEPLQTPPFSALGKRAARRRLILISGRNKSDKLWNIVGPS